MSSPVPRRCGPLRSRYESEPASEGRPPLGMLMAREPLPPSILEPCDAIAEGEQGAAEWEFLTRVQQYLRDLIAGRSPDPDLCCAWERFFSLHDPVVRKVAAKCGVPRREMDDCVQEVWIAIIGHLARGCYDPIRGRFSGWVCALIRNRVIDFLRLLGCRSPENGHNLDEVPDRREADPAIICQRKILAGTVFDALECLRHRVSALTFQAAYLCWIEGATCADVARQLGLTTAQVWSRHHRARTTLRELLEARHLS
jgi:RNA polymerase sigma factor (sigma-70 family)